MHALRAVDIRIYFAPKNHGYSILAQSYDFCPQLRKHDIIHFTMSHNENFKYLGYPKKFVFVVSKLKANFFAFFTSTVNVYLDAINELWYLIAKMLTKL